MRPVLFLSLVLGLASSAFAQDYDFLLKGGHVLDARNNIDAVRDVAIKDGKIAAVAENIPAARALETVDVTGLYVTPGLINLHAHVYRPTVGQGFRADNSMVYPDGFSFRAGVTTFVDPGVEKGNFGFIDQTGARLKGSERLRCEMTLRDGKVVWDLNGLAAEDWDKPRTRP